MNLFIAGFTLIMGLIAIGCIGVLWSINAYNRIARLAMGREVAWQRIIKLLGRRFELLPALIHSIQGSLASQDSALAGIGLAHRYVLAARSIDSRVLAENVLSNFLPVFSMLQQKYPDLQERPALTEALKQLQSLEAELSEEMARFNAAAEAYNQALQRFPAPLFAARTGYAKATLFGDPLPEQITTAAASLMAGETRPAETLDAHAAKEAPSDAPEQA